MSLEQYKRKRDFTVTPEPNGSRAADERAADSVTVAGSGFIGSAGGRFVVQRHRARNLHYDFRLEIDGVLISWAVPKGPTLDAAVKRAAFHVEDHPIDYFDFEGTIPRGQYGAGDVIVWDWGEFRAEATDDPGQAVRDGELKFELLGEKLRGRFTIVRTKGGAGRRGARSAGASTDTGERDQWLLIKKRDTAAVDGWDPESKPRSVKTGRTNEEVLDGVTATGASGGPQVAADAPQGARAPAGADATELEPRLLPSQSSEARRVPWPGFIEPMKATLTNRPFTHPSWLFELKWDGYRLQAHVRDGRVALFTRRAQNAAAYFPELAGPPVWIAAREAIVDGEVVALNPAGEPSFGLLQGWQGSRHGSRHGRRTGSATTGEDGPPATLVYEVFDILYLDGYSLLDVPLEDRKSLLRSVVNDSTAVRYAGHVDGEGEAFYGAVAERGLEGIVAKLRRSRYEPGRRSPAWLKIKRRQDQEFVIGGWTPRTGSDTDLGALLLGVNEAGALRPVGKVGTGFAGAERARLLALLAPLERDTPPFRPAPREKGVRWVEPRLVARVEFAEWSTDGMLRAPSYKGLELDADPASVARDSGAVSRAAPGVPQEIGAPRASARAEPVGPDGPIDAATLAELDAMPAAGGKWCVGEHELKLTNLDKLIWPADGITKRDLIRYYVAVAPHVLPYLRDRALTVMRHPNGIDKPGFWQKQLPGHAPPWIGRWSWHSVSAGEIRDYAVVDGAAALAWLANEAAIDLHPSTYRIDAPDRPTWALVDIDPGTQTTWDDVLDLARLYRTALEHLGVSGFPKVSGQRGIQVWIPIRPIYTFEQTRDWVAGVSRAVAATMPQLVSWEWEKMRRGGLARLDYTQNAFNKTLVAPYAVRPVAGAPVSAPISWDELDDPALRPNGWSIRSILPRLAERGDLFAPALELEQELPRL